MAFLQYETVRLSYSDGAGAAGTYTKPIVTLPAGSIIVDVLVHANALWNQGTSATLIVGDSVDDDGFYTAVNLKATDLLAAESLSFADNGGKQGADVDAVAAGMQVRRRRLATERTITAKVTAVGTAATTGEVLVTVIYAAPGEGTTGATFA